MVGQREEIPVDGDLSHMLSERAHLGVPEARGVNRRRHLIVLDSEGQITRCCPRRETALPAARIAACWRRRTERGAAVQYIFITRHGSRATWSYARVGCGIDGGGGDPVRHDVVGVPVFGRWGRTSPAPGAVRHG